MIRHLHPTDPPAFLPFKEAAGRARAYPLPMAISGNGGAFPAVRYAGAALSPRAWRSCWIKSEGSRIQVALRAGQRSGRLAWEVRDLYVHRDFKEAACEALEDLSAPAASAGARRIFIRIRSDDALLAEARRAGYVPLETETLYRVESSTSAYRRLGLCSAPMQLRPRAKADDDALFRLHCASTPLNLRMRSFSTTAEWRDGLEKPGRNVHERILEDAGGSATGWLRTANAGRGRYFEAAALNEIPDAMHCLLAAVLEMDTGPVSTLVPERSASLAGMLRDIGFEELHEYAVLVKALAARAAQTRSVASAVG